MTLRRLTAGLDGQLRRHPKTVRAGLAILGCALIAGLAAAAWPILLEIRSEHIAAADPRPDYVNRVRDKIQKTTETALAGTPPRESPAGLRVRIQVNADGHVAAAKVEESSGDAALDALALHLVRQASPFEPFPPDMRRTTKLVELGSEFYFH
jgi:TonB family protein